VQSDERARARDRRAMIAANETFLIIQKSHAKFLFRARVFAMHRGF
jgi:hypothetical protein